MAPREEVKSLRMVVSDVVCLSKSWLIWAISGDGSVSGTGAGIAAGDARRKAGKTKAIGMSLENNILGDYEEV
jgi:hypothetical protein